MTTCTNCGQQNEAAASFCRQCGQRINQAQPQGYGQPIQSAQYGQPPQPQYGQPLPLQQDWNGPSTTEDDNAPSWLREIRHQQQEYGVNQQPQIGGPQGQPGNVPVPNIWGTPSAPSAYGDPSAWGAPPIAPAWSAPELAQQWGQPTPIDPRQQGMMPPQPGYGQPPSTPFTPASVFNENHFPEWLQQASMQPGMGQPSQYPSAYPVQDQQSGWNGSAQVGFNPSAWGQAQQEAPFGRNNSGPQDMRARDFVEDDALPAWLRALPDSNSAANATPPAAWMPPPQPMNQVDWMNPTASRQDAPWSMAADQEDPFRRNQVQNNGQMSAAEFVDESALPAWLRNMAPQSPAQLSDGNPQYAQPNGTPWNAAAPYNTPAPGTWDSRQSPSEFGQANPSRWSNDAPALPSQRRSNTDARFSASDLIDPNVLNGVNGIQSGRPVPPAYHGQMPVQPNEFPLPPANNLPDFMRQPGYGQPDPYAQPQQGYGQQPEQPPFGAVEGDPRQQEPQNGRVRRWFGRGKPPQDNYRR